MRRLNRAFAQARSASAALNLDPSVTRQLATPEEHNLLSLLYPFAIGMAEDFSAGALLDATQSLLGTNSLADAAWPRAEREALGSWENQFEAWKLWHGVDVGDFQFIDELRAHIQTRNALVHGAGRLSRLQAKNRPRVLSELRLIGVQFESDVLRIGDPTIGQLREVVEAFVLWLDSEGP